MNGIINVYKEKGYTSHDVVAKLRGIFGQKRIGHTGTLDPDAEGVLPICLGKAARACDMLAEKDKVYETTLLLGKATDTQDLSGKVLEEKEVVCLPAQAEAAIMGFVGAYRQIPPMYSALKVNGKKLCDLARAGVTVERKPRDVEIFSIEIQEIALPKVKMSVHCSKGTYIRTLCHDVGIALGCGGCMESLVRTRVAGFALKDAWRLDGIEAQVKKAREQKKDPKAELSREDLDGLVKDTDVVFLQYPEVSVKAEYTKALYNGNPLQEGWLSGWQQEYQEQMIRVYDSSQVFVGVYRWEEARGVIKPVKIFADC
ncbi:tRNA pseudouridine(55) synthase TruB [Lachnospiraceae bacterium 29-84]